MERLACRRSYFGFKRIYLHKFSFPAGPQQPTGAGSASPLIRWRTFNWLRLQSSPSDSSLNVIYAGAFLKAAFSLFTEHQAVITHWP